MRTPPQIFWPLLAALSGCAKEQEPPPIPQPPPAPLSEAPEPEFAVALWPGEGIPEFDAVGAPLALRTSPRATTVAGDTLRPAAGTRIRYDSTRTVTITPARIEVLRGDTVSGRDFGVITTLTREAYYATAPEVHLEVTPGTEMELLQYRAEGTCFVRVDGRVIEASPCPSFDGGAFRPTGEPVTAWWIFVAGGSYGGGWVQVTDSTVRLAGRHF